MPSGRILPVFGISGVGKSSLINAISTENSLFLHTSASSIISRILSSNDTTQAEPQHLDKADLLRIQEIAVLEILRISKVHKKRIVILDAHNVIDVGDDLVRVPVKIFESLSPMQLFFVYDNPEEIEKRRITDTTRHRPYRSVSELANYQEIALDTAQTYSRILGIDLTQVKSGDLVSFRTAVSASINSAKGRN